MQECMLRCLLETAAPSTRRDFLQPHHPLPVSIHLQPPDDPAINQLSLSLLNPSHLVCQPDELVLQCDIFLFFDATQIHVF